MLKIAHYTLFFFFFWYNCSSSFQYTLSQKKMNSNKRECKEMVLYMFLKALMCLYTRMTLTIYPKIVSMTLLITAK